MRKRARIHAPHTSDIIELWWDAQSSDAFIANTLPPLPSLAASGPAPPPLPSRPQDRPTNSAKTKKRKRRPPKPAPPRPRSLLALMNSNISTQRRIRRTHAKFVAISAATAATNNVAGEDGEGGGDVPIIGPQAGLAGEVDADDPEVDAVDERPWPVPRPGPKLVSEGSLDVKPDIGEQAAEKCIQWVNRKILEHVGFQGTPSLLSRMGYGYRDMHPQGHHSWHWMCSQGSQWSTCQMLGVRSASISTSIQTS